MSDVTKAALDAAIAAHVADEYDGDMVTAWVVVTETTTLGMLDEGEGSMAVSYTHLDVYKRQVVEHRTGVWFGECWPCLLSGSVFVFGEHSGGIGMLGVHVPPPLDCSALMLFGHAAMVQQKQPHG